MSFRRLGVRTRRALVALGVAATAAGVASHPAAAAPGDTRVIAGQGKKPTCYPPKNPDLSKPPVRGDSGEEPFGSASFHDGIVNFSVTVTGADPGTVYIAERSYVREKRGQVPGVLPTQGIVPVAVAVDHSGANLYIAERTGASGGQIRHVQLAGNSTIRTLTVTNQVPVDIAADQTGNLYVGYGDGSIVKRNVLTNREQALRTVPGLSGLAVDRLGTRLFVAAAEKNKVLEVDPASANSPVQRVAGSEIGAYGSTGDGGVATDALLHVPRAVAVDPEGRHLYVLDQTRTDDASTVRHIDLNTSEISTVAGPRGTGEAADLEFTGFDLAVDGGQNLFIVDRDNCAVYSVSDPRKPPAKVETTETTAAGATQTTNTTVGTTTPTTTPATVPDTVPATVPAGRTVFSPSSASLTPIDASNSSFGVNALAQGANPPMGADPLTAVAPPPPTPEPAATASAVPGAPQSAFNSPGLVSADGQPARGATRYAMVREEDDVALTGVALLVGGAMSAVFLCAMLAAPRAASKPKPRPRGAY